MSHSRLLTDRPSLCLRRARAKLRDASFLHEEAIAEIEDRLAMVNKSFHDMVIVTGHPEIWADAFPQARIIEDIETLDLNVQAHDLIVHAMALHWADDPVGQLIQCQRALRPDGLLLVAMLGGETLHELRACLAQSETAVLGGLSPRVLPMADLRDMGALLQRSGFALPVADTHKIDVQYDNMFHLIRDLRAMGETNAMHDRLRHATPRAVFAQAAEAYQAHFSAPNGKVSATFEMIYLSGWAPDESQQKPLRPGSATQRLADALGTSENPLKD